MLRFALYAVAAGVVLVLFWRVLGSWMVSREDRLAERDPATGVLRGAAARVLGPVDAPNAVLFVHGYAGAGDNFADLPDRLAEAGWRVDVMRLPGHGTSPRDLERVTADELIDAVTHEVDALRAQHGTVAVVGHSMGATLATLAASKGGVDALVLGAPYFGVTHRWYYGLRPETWETIAAYPLRWVYKGKLFLQLNDRQNADKITAYDVLPTRSLLMLHALADRVNAPGLLESLRCPELILHSHGDVAASPDATVAAFERMGSTDKRIVWLERSNHHVFWDYDMKQVQEDVIGFLRTQAGEPSDAAAPRPGPGAG